jgi:hypothetical protein
MGLGVHERERPNGTWKDTLQLLLSDVLGLLAAGPGTGEDGAGGGRSGRMGLGVHERVRPNGTWKDTLQLLPSESLELALPLRSEGD